MSSFHLCGIGQKGSADIITQELKDDQCFSKKICDSYPIDACRGKEYHIVTCDMAGKSEKQEVRMSKTVAIGVQDFGKIIEQKCPEDYRCAQKIAAFLKQAYGWDVGEGEVLYLALHLNRINQNI